jgi:hypothetical protein
MLTRYVALSMALVTSACASAAVPSTPGPQTWAAPGDAYARSDLLFVSNGTYVSGYVVENGVAQGDEVVNISPLEDAQGLCTDTAGHVWVTQGKLHTVSEYTHDGFHEINTIVRSSGNPTGCAVDPKTRDLAVTYNYPDKHYANVVIYPNGRTPGHAYSNSTGLEDAYFLAYDDSGDLYVDGYACGYGSCGQHPNVLMVLTPGADAFHPIVVRGARLKNPRGLSWTNHELLIGDYEAKYGDAIGYILQVTHGAASVVESIPFVGTYNAWGTSVFGGVVFVPDQTNSAVNSYSLSNRSFISTLQVKIDHPFSAVVSRAVK